MILNHHWIIKSPIYMYFHKHYCPKCHVEVNVVTESKIVYAGSEDAIALDLRAPGGGSYFGRVKVNWKEFECPQCGDHFTVDQMRAIEKGGI